MFGMVALDDVRRLGQISTACSTGCWARSTWADSLERDGLCFGRERLERYVGAMSNAERLRLGGALRLLSGRLDKDLAAPDRRVRDATVLQPAVSYNGL
jgi:hypothetical protein